MIFRSLLLKGNAGKLCQSSRGSQTLLENPSLCGPVRLECGGDNVMRRPSRRQELEPLTIKINEQADGVKTAPGISCDQLVNVPIGYDPFEFPRPWKPSEATTNPSRPLAVQAPPLPLPLPRLNSAHLPSFLGRSCSYVIMH